MKRKIHISYPCNEDQRRHYVHIHVRLHVGVCVRVHVHVYVHVYVHVSMAISSRLLITETSMWVRGKWTIFDHIF